MDRQPDALGAERRKLPMVKIEKEYVFDGPNGRTTLRDLFEGRRQLIIYDFVFDPSWDKGCQSCSHLADNLEGTVVHLRARNTSLAVVSRAPLANIDPFRRRMGWKFRWFSSFGSAFNYDFHKDETPGLIVFLQDGRSMFHTYSTYQRGLDLFLNTYNYLDVTPLGRQEEDGRIQAWIRHHDKHSVDDSP